MRRRFALLSAAVVIVGAVAAVPASADTRAAGSIVVTTIDRHGTPVPTALRAVRPRDGASFTFRSGHTRRLPYGHYDVVVDIIDKHDYSATVAVKPVTVDG